ncbi:hypothetical protein PCL_05673 [Purpureocillium lilacinum]|uniref:Uncharacterized protein n=1 Tax=Purpureocillium lilacinum TaxID=33203 RepID=A0A2U3DUL5_PURLI|nr:hypothetical protein Purlil1_5556 [Purpureocillium lilacinum]PWI65945.1 hypothetical protein PCL_05673 [Purpureocillium lilacinum]
MPGFIDIDQNSRPAPQTTLPAIIPTYRHRQLQAPSLAPFEGLQIFALVVAAAAAAAIRSATTPAAHESRVGEPCEPWTRTPTVHDRYSSSAITIDSHLEGAAASDP